jgi:putative membrane protein
LAVLGFDELALEERGYIVTMSEEGGAPATAAHEGPAPVAATHHTTTAGNHPGMNGVNGINTAMPVLTHEMSPMSPRGDTPNPFSRKNSSLDLDDYFRGPRDIAKHSKWPMFLQMHGSILPKMILPLFAVGVWATTVTVINWHFSTPGVQYRETSTPMVHVTTDRCNH